MAEQHTVTTEVTVTSHTTTVQAQQTAPSGGRRTIYTINVGYFKSWQGLLKILKLLFGIACIVSSALAIDSYSTYAAYPLATATFLFLTELIWFLLYICAFNRQFPKCVQYLIISYHLLSVILYYAAVIIFARIGGDHASAYVAFGMLQTAAFFMEAYFNVTWLNGGPELIALPCMVRN